MANREDWSGVIRNFANKERERINRWFENNKPIMEFAIFREGEYINYGIWDGEEDLIVMFKNPNGRYNFHARMRFDKELLKALGKLI
jgi:hypothetical protein